MAKKKSKQAKRFEIRTYSVPPELYKAAKDKADKEGRALSAIIQWFLQRYIGGKIKPFEAEEGDE